MSKLIRRTEGKLQRRAITCSPYHWDRIKPDENVCFVCGKAINKEKDPVCIGKKDGVLLRRHRSCDCLSSAWKRKFKGCTSLTNEANGK